MKYQHNNKSVTLVNYHIVFTPKYHRRVLVGEVKKRLEEIIGKLALEKKWKIIAREVMPDHIHLFIRASVDMKPNQIVKLIKGRSSRILRQEFIGFQRLPSFWTPSFFLSTAGSVSSTTVKRYIDTQWDRVKM